MKNEPKTSADLGADAGLQERLADPRPVLIGVVHLLALPGAPGVPVGRESTWMESVLAAARRDAKALADGGADAVIVENFGDVPFHPEAVPPETISAMARAIDAVAGAAPRLPLGVNVLRNDARAAVGLCATTVASFLRVNVHVGAMLTDQGLIQGQAAETMRARARLAPDALLMADVHVKHAAPLADQRIEESAEETLGRGLADFVIVSGTRTGGEPDSEELERVAARVGAARVFLGSGLNQNNARALLAHARGAIVGTSIKVDGRLEQPVDPARVAGLRALVDGS